MLFLVRWLRPLGILSPTEAFVIKKGFTDQVMQVSQNISFALHHMGKLLDENDLLACRNVSKKTMEDKGYSVTDKEMHRFLELFDDKNWNAIKASLQNLKAETEAEIREHGEIFREGNDADIGKRSTLDLSDGSGDDSMEEKTDPLK